jgi:hypothetical protein
LPYAAAKLPYAATPDASNEAWGLATEEGAFLYNPCLGGAKGRCLEQVTPQPPIFWQIPWDGTPTPYAITGALSWSNYTVSSDVLFTNAAGSAGLIGRYDDQARDPKLFDGYQFDLTAKGAWRLAYNTKLYGPTVLARGQVDGIQAGHWYKITLTMIGDQVSASVNSKRVVKVTSALYRAGQAGIESNYNRVQFSKLTVTTAG